MKKFLFFMALCLGFLIPVRSEASVSFQYVTDTPVVTGTTATVNIYLLETDTGTSTSILSGRNGIYSYGWYVQQTAGASTGQSTIASVTSASPFTAFSASGNGFSSSNSSPPSSLPANSADYFNSQAAGGSTSNGTAITGGYKILLGTLSFNVGTATTFTITSQNSTTLPDNGTGGTAGGDNTFSLPASASLDLDASSTDQTTNQSYTGANAFTNTFIIQSSAVPEPSSMALAGLAIAGMGFGYWRRRRAKLAEAVAQDAETPAQA
jgi:hypothetical protein